MTEQLHLIHGTYSRGIWQDSDYQTGWVCLLATDNNNNNNNQICIAQVCRMTSEALDGHLQSCYTARARPKCLTEEKCF